MPFDLFFSYFSVNAPTALSHPTPLLFPQSLSHSSPKFDLVHDAALCCTRCGRKTPTGINMNGKVLDKGKWIGKTNQPRHTHTHASRGLLHPPAPNVTCLRARTEDETKLVIITHRRRRRRLAGMAKTNTTQRQHRLLRNNGDFSLSLSLSISLTCLFLIN